MIYQSIITHKGKQLALLIDPDKHTQESLLYIAQQAQNLGVHYIFVGGSLIQSNIAQAVRSIKTTYRRPVILFPGSVNHVTHEVDALLFLSLISGRNAEFLIGNHVIAAPIIKQTGLEVIPTGYILVEGGTTTSVEYMSNTRPIPATKTDIAVATALAGEMLGMKLLYLEAGSGALHAVPAAMIHAVKQHCSIPLIVGGGIRTIDDLQQAFSAGADIAVVGTSIEKNPALLDEMMQSIQEQK
ncbi:MAG: geranylgeranylglyceryl/heptaprenylglyceryl phosphate synthase [Bacteroidales bacterium]|jgi:putative glycerol-1-phosphate prenyltransferase|nr:geranylgeranylglyceryl/heptaprenylglyceryl phosphate synthase [Bacteroidales bacterium]